MAIEIERKFLVKDDAWRAAAGPGTLLVQGYLCSGGEATVRLRLAADRAWLTIKGTTVDLARPEFEYVIPRDDALALLDLCLPWPIEKTRYRVEHAGRVWDVDVFHGANAPLVTAEVELARADEQVEVPAWVGAEVSDDPRYRNASLARHPFGNW